MILFFYWSGLVAWLCIAILGLGALFDLVGGWVIDTFWSRKEFLAFTWSRLKRDKVER